MRNDDVLKKKKPHHDQWVLGLDEHIAMTHNPIPAPLSSGISHDFLNNE